MDIHTIQTIHNTMNRTTDLLLDVKTLIASCDEWTWYLMYRFDAEFRAYAMSEHARQQFVELFTVRTKTGDYEKYALFGECHREGDLPAFIETSGSQWWFMGGKPHRDGDKPAITHADGTQLWFRHGQLHREGDLPAVISNNGTRARFVNGVFVGSTK
jgi:hypothetical protein